MKHFRRFINFITISQFLTMILLLFWLILRDSKCQVLVLISISLLDVTSRVERKPGVKSSCLDIELWSTTPFTTSVLLWRQVWRCVITNFCRRRVPIMISYFMFGPYLIYCVLEHLISIQLVMLLCHIMRQLCIIFIIFIFLVGHKIFDLELSVASVEPGE